MIELKTATLGDAEVDTPFGLVVVSTFSWQDNLPKVSKDGSSLALEVHAGEYH